MDLTPGPSEDQERSEERLEVGQYGEFFATRHRGRQVYDHAVTLLDDADTLVLDFSGVEAVTGAFADELVANLIVRYADRIVLAGMSHDVAETIEQALDRREALEPVGALPVAAEVCGEVGTSWPNGSYQPPAYTEPCALPADHDEDHDWAHADSCQQSVWDGPYRMRCGHTLVDGRCVRHGAQSPARQAEGQERSEEQERWKSLT